MAYAEVLNHKVSDLKNSIEVIKKRLLGQTTMRTDIGPKSNSDSNSVDAKVAIVRNSSKKPARWPGNEATKVERIVEKIVATPRKNLHSECTA